MLTAFLLCSGISAEAQQPALRSTPASREVMLNSALWLRSTNSAGLALDSLRRTGDIGLSASYSRGGLKSVWSGENETDVKVSTSGIAKVGGVTLYGDFSYDYIAVNSSKYNCVLYEPSWDQPYYVADFSVSDWRKQAYDMQFRAASPLFFGGRASFGLDAGYKALVGAKQVDPRTETFRYDISVAPSAVLQLGEASALGLRLEYFHSFERSNPSVENYTETPRVAIMRGLGFYTLGSAGGNIGFDIFYYKTNRFGGSLQYVLRSRPADLMVEAGVHYTTALVSENPELPRMRGRIGKLTVTFDAAAGFGADKNHRLDLDAEFGMTSGYEYNQRFDSSPEVYKWITVSNPMMSTYDILEAAAKYSWYRSIASGEYDFKLGAAADIFMMNQRYIAPASRFNASNASLGVFAGWNIHVGRGGRLLPSLNLGWRMSPSGEYFYGDAAPDNAGAEIVSTMYPEELRFLTSDRLESGAGLTWAPAILGSSSLTVSLDAGFDWSFSLSDWRLDAALGLKYLF